MKRRINLLSINFTKRKLSEVAGDFRMKALIVLGILLLIGVAELFIHLYLQNEIKKYELSKATLEQYVTTNKSFEDKIKFFFYKYGLLTTYLKEDANGYAYYTKVQGLITKAAPTAKMTSFSYKNNGETNFTLSFANYTEASSFITTLESPLFLDIFEYVELQGFDATEKLTSKEVTLTIVAQFIPEK